MITGYSKNLNVQYLIALLQAHGIKRIIASPGTTDLEFVAGLQYNGGFEIYSSVDERSAAYMACGMASESNEPVVITCTEATASRDYFPGLTEAFYRKLPILAVTGVHRYYRIGHLEPQVIDRSVSPLDVFIHKEQLPVIKDTEDEKESQFRINRAILALKRKGGGPVHIDLPCCDNDYDFKTKELPSVQVIKRYTYGSDFPILPIGKIVVFIGSHFTFDEKTTNAIDLFCSKNNAVVFHDHTSGYKGKWGVKLGLLSAQNGMSYDILKDINLIIHLGEAVADQATMTKLKKAKQVWRVNPDGELRNTFGKLDSVFEMREIDFFTQYLSKEGTNSSYLEECKKIKNGLKISSDTIPFSNIYVASKISANLPKNSVIHLGPSNTIRAWSMFEFPDSIRSAANMGCRGIDGVISTCLGASLLHPENLYFCILGDLTFFYDMNALGNRHVGNNLRILLINNNGGGIFKQANAPAHMYFGDEEANKFVAASGHFGNHSRTLVKHYAEDMGLEYIAAASKEEFESKYKHFLDDHIKEKSMIFEVFTKDEDEREAFKIASSLETNASGKIKDFAKQVLGPDGVKKVKKLFS